MKNTFKKITITVLSIIIFICISVVIFNFINNRKNNLSSQLQNNELPFNQNLSANVILENNPVNTDNEVVKKAPNNNPKISVASFYYGVGAKGLTPIQVSKLTKVSSENTFPFATTVSPYLQVWYFAYPAFYPPLTSIKDPNGFELLPDFTVTTGNISEESGHKAYRIYEYNNITTLSLYKVTYK